MVPWVKKIGEGKRQKVAIFQQTKLQIFNTENTEVIGAQSVNLVSNFCQNKKCAAPKFVIFEKNIPTKKFLAR